MTGWRKIGLRAWRFEGLAVPDAARGRWCVLSVEGLPAAVREAALTHVEFLDGVGKVTGGRVNPRRATGRGTCFIPGDACGARVELLGARRPSGAAALSYRPTGTGEAAVRLLSARPGIAAELAFGIGPALLSPERAKARLRAALARAIALEAPPGDYRTWFPLFGTLSPEDLPAAREGPSLGFLVFASGLDANHPAPEATLHSLRRQQGQGPLPTVAVVGGAGRPGWRTALESLPPSDYVGLLQAGEVLPPHAALLARAQLAALGSPAAAYADEDEWAGNGEPPASPLFKPEPNRALMVSGTLSRGLWLVRRGLLPAVLDDDAPNDGHRWAESLRLDLWLRLHEAGCTRENGTRRLPFVLTHRRPDTPAAPPEELARVVGAHFRRARLPFDPEPAWPLRIRPRASPRFGKVTAIVPSALRSTEAERCIRAVLAGTRYAEFELVVAVCQPGPLDAAQRAAAARIEAADSRARVLPLRAERFNFSWVNNQAVAETAGDAVLLLNDDVTPVAPDWLDAMAAHLADPAVAIVGAKLLYPGGTVQHGGVIMGLSGLCDHAHRHLDGEAHGYAGRAVLAQELSAVTGACLLVRRAVLERLGGLDEAYPSAFNDVDLCLRAREAGYAVLFAPDAVLHHDELRTYGSHYAGDRARFQDIEAERMRARWAGVIAEDPFHNPNLGLATGREWQPSFPPRSRRGHCRFDW